MNRKVLLLSLTAGFVVLCVIFLFSGISRISVSGKGLQEYLQDAEALTVQEKLDAILGNEAENPDPAGRININTASSEELATLPGIGETLADRIIRYRTYNGPFEKAEYIQDVTGIGEGLYQKMREFIYAG